MVMVYDMVTFGVCEPDSAATPIQDNTPNPGIGQDIPELGLQLVEARPIAAQHALPPNLHHADAERFLKQWDKP